MIVFTKATKTNKQESFLISGKIRKTEIRNQLLDPVSTRQGGTRSGEQSKK